MERAGEPIILRIKDAKMFTFLIGLDDDLRKALLIQLRNLWTHTSTAIEGNTLTLGETAFVLKEELTISGKPLQDHEEVVGHARAIDLIYDFIHIHPFWDGNGRMARLVANIPVIRAGLPPIIIPMEKRQL